jgi:hypothetical protein
MKILDLGTEFGLSTDANGTSQVRVFEGAVEVEPKVNGQNLDQAKNRRTLLAGQVGLVEAKGVFLEKPDVTEVASTYVRTMPNNYENDYVRNIISSRPWGYWNFNSVISSTLIPDVAGHGRFGQLRGNAMVVQGGSIMAIGQAAAFDGEGDSVQIPTGSTVSFNGDFSIEALFRTVNEGVLVAKVPDSRNWLPGSKILFLRGGAVKFTPFSEGKKPKALIANLLINDNQWHHVVLTNKANVSGQLDSTTLFVDGVQRSSRADWDITSHDDANFPLTIGHGCSSYPVNPDKRVPEFPSHRYFQGNIDETAIYTRCLTCDEVQSHYRAYLVAGIHRRNSTPDLGVLPSDSGDEQTQESEED